MVAHLYKKEACQKMVLGRMIDKNKRVITSKIIVEKDKKERLTFMVLSGSICKFASARALVKRRACTL